MNTLQSLSAKDFDDVLTLASGFDPESLTCDGELNESEVNARLQELRREWTVCLCRLQLPLDIDPDSVMDEYLFRLRNGHRRL